MQCLKCGKDNLPTVSYCIECGNQLKGIRIDVNDLNKKHFTHSIFLFLSITLIILFSILFRNSMSLLTFEIIFNCLLLTTSTIFISLNFNAFLRLLTFQVRAKPILFILFGAPIIAVVVIYFAHFLNSSLFKVEEVTYFEAFKIEISNTWLLGILFVSIMPGILEEFLFRGVLFNSLLKLTTPKVVILITSLLFSFIHFSFLALFWLFPLGLIMGYLRFRYRTIWYGILFHALYNASIFYFETIISFK